MSNSQFLRLYREIDRSLPSKKTIDHSYEKERHEALAKLPEFRGLWKQTPPVPRPKHHGKLIRQFNHGLDKERKKELDRQERERRQKQEINKVMRQSIEIKDIIDSLHESAEKRTKIPILTLKKMDLLDEREGKLSSMSPNPLSTSMSSPSLSLDPNDPRLRRRQSSFPVNPSELDDISINTGLLPRLETRTSVLAKPSVNFRHVRVYDKSYSKARWSTEEREKLHKIYQEMLLPPRRCHVEIWKAYFREFCQRFQCFFPERSLEEIIDKGREMIAKNQMKENGEEMFWNFFFETKFIEREKKIPTVGKNVYSK